MLRAQIDDTLMAQATLSPKIYVNDNWADVNSPTFITEEYEQADTPNDDNSRSPLLAVDRPKILETNLSSGADGYQSQYIVFNKDFSSNLANDRKFWTNAKEGDQFAELEAFETDVRGNIIVSGITQGNNPKNIGIAWRTIHYIADGSNAPTYQTARVKIVPVKFTTDSRFVTEIDLNSFSSEPVVLKTNRV